MRQHESNPPANALQAGVTEEMLAAAIEKSGYPLQSIVVDRVLEAVKASSFGECQAQEEWSFVDADSGQARQLDALVSCNLEQRTTRSPGGMSESPADYLRIGLDFLIECKQSDLPYVFFLRAADTGKMPAIVGLPYPELSIGQKKDDPIQVGMSVYDTLGMYDYSFAHHEHTAISITRAYRKGQHLELSGEEAFKGISMPLLKAVDYYTSVLTPSAGRLFFDVRCLVPVAVFRAPLIGVRMEGETPILATMPWIRVVRTDPSDNPGRRFESSVRAFDAVHVDYLSTYVSEALVSANGLAIRAQEFAMALVTGQAIMGRTRPGSRAASDQPPYRQMSDALSDREFATWIAKRWKLVHQRG